MALFCFSQTLNELSEFRADYPELKRGINNLDKFFLKQRTASRQSLGIGGRRENTSLAAHQMKRQLRLSFERSEKLSLCSNNIIFFNQKAPRGLFLMDFAVSQAGYIGMLCYRLIFLKK